MGYRTEGTCGWCNCSEVQEVPTIVATFDSKSLAEKYVRKSMLKHPKRWGSPFRVKSLLCGYGSIDIEEIVVEDPVPHNPN